MNGESGRGNHYDKSNFIINLFALPLATWITIFGSIGAGTYWLFGLEAKMKEINKDLIAFQANVLNLNTPLSQRVFSLEARVNEIARIQTEVRIKLDNMDNNGTSHNKILKQEVENLRAEITGQNIRCSDLARKLDEINNMTIENRVRIQNIIEAINPHEIRQLKK